MVKVPFESDDDLPENADHSDPIGSLGSEKEVWIDSNFSRSIPLTFYPPSKMKQGFLSPDEIYSEGVSSAEIISMTMLIPPDVEEDEPLRIIALIRNSWGEYEVYHRSAIADQSFVLETELNFMEWSDMDGWEEHEMEVSASFCEGALEGELLHLWFHFDC